MYHNPYVEENGGLSLNRNVRPEGSLKRLQTGRDVTKASLKECQAHTVFHRVCPFPSFERYCGSRNPARGVMAEGKCYKETFSGEVQAKESLSGVWFTLPAVSTNRRD